MLSSGSKQSTRERGIGAWFYCFWCCCCVFVDCRVPTHTPTRTRTHNDRVCRNPRSTARGAINWERIKFSESVRESVRESRYQSSGKFRFAVSVFEAAVPEVGGGQGGWQRANMTRNQGKLRLEKRKSMTSLLVGGKASNTPWGLEVGQWRGRQNCNKDRGEKLCGSFYQKRLNLKVSFLCLVKLLHYDDEKL